MDNLELNLISNTKKLKYKKKEHDIEKDIQIILNKIKKIDINLLDSVNSNEVIVNYLLSTIKTIQYLEFIKNKELSKKKCIKDVVDNIIDGSINIINTQSTIDKKILINNNKKDKLLEKYFTINKIE